MMGRDRRGYKAGVGKFKFDANKRGGGDGAFIFRNVINLIGGAHSKRMTYFLS